jgi:HEAT repeat protein
MWDHPFQKDVPRPAVVEALKPMIRDEDPDVRWMAAKALIKVTPESVPPELRKAIEDGPQY